MRLYITAVCCLAAALVLASVSDAALRIAGVKNLVNNVQRLTGPAYTQTPYDIGGTDLGIPIYHNDRMYLLFGDTFSSEDSISGTNWRRNTTAWSSDTIPSNGITLNGWATAANGMAKQTFTNNAPAGVVTNIPTGGISVNGNLYVWFMNVTQWGPASGEWYISQAELAKWNDATTSFTVVNNNTFAGNGNFGMVAAREGVDGDPYIYLWGTPAGRLGKVKLARFLPAQIEDRGSYEFYDGLVNGVPQWTSDEFAADYVINATVGEMSVFYNRCVDTWTMLYFNESNDRVQIRQAYDPWGPWSAPVTVMTQGQCPSGTFGLYAPYMHPRWVEYNGRTVYFTYSLWTPYDVYLAKVTLDTAPTGSVVINAGAGYTNSTTVTLSLAASDDSGTASQMRISSDGTFDTEPWEAYVLSKNWTLPSGDGTKTLYVRFRDSSNYESETCTDTIVLDTTPPTITAVDVEPDMVAEGDSVHVTVNATDSIGVASVSVDTDVQLTRGVGTMWEGSLTAGSAGSHSLTVNASDAAGNTSTHTSTRYISAPVLGIALGALNDALIASASELYLFKVYGRVRSANGSGFDLTDGHNTIHVNCSGYSGIADNDYVTARGILTPGATPLLTAQPAHVKR